jgi:hypothetical protein
MWIRKLAAPMAVALSLATTGAAHAEGPWKDDPNHCPQIERYPGCYPVGVPDSRFVYTCPILHGNSRVYEDDKVVARNMLDFYKDRLPDWRAVDHTGSTPSYYQLTGPGQYDRITIFLGPVPISVMYCSHFYD